MPKKRARHKCQGYLPEWEFGSPTFLRMKPPIDECVETKDGKLIAGQAGIGTQVAHCPYCGFKSRNPPTPTAYDDSDLGDDLDLYEEDG
jgi:hypothetical protein